MRPAEEETRRGGRTDVPLATSPRGERGGAAAGAEERQGRLINFKGNNGKINK